MFSRVMYDGLPTSRGQSDSQSAVIRTQARQRLLLREVARAKESLAAQQQDIAAQQRVIELLKNELNSVLVSNSWLWTAPLRKLRNSGPIHRYSHEEARQFIDRICDVAAQDAGPAEESTITKSSANHQTGDAGRSVLFLASGSDPMTVAYRSGAISARLANQGWLVHSAHIGALPEACDYSVVVMVRTPLDARLEAFLVSCRDAGSVLIYDVDDLLFLDEVFPEMEALARRTGNERTRTIEGFRSCRDAALLADFWTVSTIELQRELEVFGKPIQVIPNAMPEHGPDQPTVRRWPQRGPIQIGYFSGSKTHQADFAALLGPLEEVLRTHEDAQLVLAGHIEAQFPPVIEQRVVRHGFAPHHESLNTLQHVDLALAPLVATRFNSCKSELKIFEPAFFGIPAIASRNPTTEATILNNWNGWLVNHTADDWHAALEARLSDRDSLIEAGANASRTIAVRHSPGSVARTWSDFLSGVCEKVT